MKTETEIVAEYLRLCIRTEKKGLRLSLADRSFTIELGPDILFYSSDLDGVDMFLYGYEAARKD